MNIYHSLHILVPVILSGSAYILYQKILFKGRTLYFLEAAVLLFGQGQWTVLNLIYLATQDALPSDFNRALLFYESLFCIMYSVMLLGRPSMRLAQSLLIIGVVLLGVKMFMISEAEPGSYEFTGLASHIFFEVVILAYAVIGIKRFRKSVLPAVTAKT